MKFMARERELVLQNYNSNCVVSLKPELCAHNTSVVLSFSFEYEFQKGD